MEENINQIIEIVKKSIIHDIDNNDTKAIKMVLDAYNHYQEDELDSTDYLFDITNQHDLKCMVEGGLTASQIAFVWNKMRDEHLSPYFNFGCNYDGIAAVGTFDDLSRKLISWLDVILPSVLKYAARSIEYANIYEHYITECLETKWNK